MAIEITNRYTGEVICTGESLLEAVKSNLANLRWADLRWADLRGANLCGANLRWANLRGANLYGADLCGADLYGAKIAWRSHDLLAELLRRAAGDDIAKIKVAGLLLVCRERCWDQFLEIAARDPLGDWALDTLAAWVQDGDGAPGELQERAEKLAAEEQSQ